jgi:hypothetical protein
MRKILTTVTGLIAFAIAGASCSAVDTHETTSTAPSISAVQITPEAIELRHDPVSRSVERAAIKPTVKPVQKVTKPTVHKVTPKPKATKHVTPKVHKTIKHKTVKVKKVIHKTHKTTRKVGLSGIASCIAKYESGGNPRAQNPHSSASGLFQFIDGTWNHFGGYARAMYAPVSIQLQKFYIVWNGGSGAGNWVVAHKCGW